MPFVTEEIWQTIPHVKSHLPETEEVRPQIGNESGIKESIMVSDYPKSLPRDYQAEEDMSYIIEAVMGIRTIRGELNISPSFKLKVMIKTFTQMAEKILKGNMQYLKNLAKASEINIGINVEKPEYSATSVKSFMEIYVPLKGVLNIAAEIDRLKKEEAKVEGSIASLNKKLFNEDFLQRAPKEIVDKEKAKYEELIIIKRRIMESIKMLEDVEVRNDS
jgi:valyl-tRNA synthetase